MSRRKSLKLPASIRRITDPLFSRVRVPILSGVNRGLWWSMSSAGSGYASGRRASEQMRLLVSLMHTGDVVWDVGAHHGYVTLCAAQKVGCRGSVMAFEPSVQNRAALSRHVQWNALANVMVLPFALSNYEGETSFGGAGTSKMFALGAGAELVQVRSGEAMVAQFKRSAPDFVKIDVEGAEGETLEGLLEVLPLTARLFIAMHSKQADMKCSALLEGAGWQCVPSGGLQQSRRGQWQSDPDLFCMGPEYAGCDADLVTLRKANF